MKLSSNARRFSAVALAAALLMLVYGLTFHPWVVGPMLKINEEEALLRASYQRFTRLEAQREAVKARLDAETQAPLAEGSLLTGPEPEAAQAQLMQLVVDRLDLQPSSGLPCSALNRLPKPVARQGQLRRIVVDAELQCGPQALATTLHKLESETPFLLVEHMDIRRLPQEQSEGPALHRLAINLQLVGYLGQTEGQVHE
ncbi:type II secretion system protein M [Pseudomonas inefficax]|uniref:type II secretion system protein GspM n=1 Tax=Pseudomonas inefficax TaxID=2078786 RepID=UPI00207BA3CE|nr:type II secretion system protein GspM [Pseudomonas inefficax]MCM8915450.1 type II secretion system protein M [Pseudomonas inefficax]